MPFGDSVFLELLTKPCFVLIGLVMFFNIANLDTKWQPSILCQDCSLVIQPFRFGTFVPTFVICFVIYQFDCDYYVNVISVEFGDFYLHFGSY